jgi:O-antigen/teichoic acid export membrane protein
LHRIREENPLPEGAVPVALGLGISGAATYVFFGVSSRALDAQAYSALSVLWGVMYAVGNGIMQPLEQEVARAVSHRRTQGLGSGPVVRRAATIGAGFTLAVIAVGLVLHSVVLDRWLGTNRGLQAAFLFGLVGFAVGHLTRGVLSSNHRFRSYGLFFGVDGLSRALLALLLAGVGYKTVGGYGLLLAFTPFLGVAAALFRQKGLVTPGPQAPWNELTSALGWLLIGTVSLSLLVQGGTIAVGILATDDQQAAAGVFLNGLQTARIPLFLFQAVLASLLPKLSRLAGTGDFDAFTHQLRRLVGTILGVGVVTTIIAAALGPWFVSIVFGSGSELGSRDLALLAAAFIIIMAAICLDQALVAMSSHSRMALGWLAAVIAFVVVIALGDDLYLRVELGLVAGSVVAFAWMVVCVMLRLRHHADVHELDLSEAVAELPVQQ